MTYPRAWRNLPQETPAKYGLPFQDVTVKTADGLLLAAWWISPPDPAANRAVVLLQHGYKSNRAEMLNEAEMLYRHGYGLLITAVRAHDASEGESITFGMEEMKDLQAW